MKLTHKQEQFTLNLLAGMSQRDAYIKAGYSKKQPISVIDSNACVLAKSSKVLARQAELNKKVESNKVAGVEERKSILTEIARARQTDFMTCSADGVWMHDIGPETINKAGLKQIQTTTMPFGSKKKVNKDDGDGDKEDDLFVILTKVELINPIQAIAELNKMEGAYAPEKHESINLNLEAKDLTDAELLSIINGRRGGGVLPEEAGQG